jgi:hypothetical protein
VMTIMSTNWKNINVWGIPSMETYLTSIFFLLAWNLFNSNLSVLISSCNFDVEKNSLCVYVRYVYTEWRHWSRAAREM